MNKEGQKVWGGVLSALKLSVSASSFKTWFSGSYAMQFEERGDKKILVVGVRSGFLKEQIEKRYMGHIDDYLKQNFSGEHEILFVVSNRESAVPAEAGAPLLSGEAPSYFNPTKRADILNSSYLFENFVTGTTNNIAHLASRQVVQNLGGTYNPLVFWGPTGVGKTHLMQAIGNDVINKYQDIKVLYATAEKFTNDYLESLRSHTQPNFRNKYRSVHLLLIDDIQFFAGKESTQDEFFHTFNELVLSGRQVIAASDRHPRELGKLKERLVSRFLGGMCADIGLPDNELKVGIILSKCKQFGVTLDREVVDYIASECQGGARELEGILTSTLTQIKLGEPLEALRKSISGKAHSKKSVTQGKILDLVSKHFKVRLSDMRGSSRRSNIAWARQVSMFLMRKHLGLPYEVIGYLFGGRDHSTVIHSIEKVAAFSQKDQSTRDELLRLDNLLSF